jgi:Tol biopolymer transport system component
VYVSPHAVPLKAALLWLDRAGNVTPVSPVERPFREPALSPDGRFLVAAVDQPNSKELWLLDIDRQTWTPLTAGRDNVNPIWSPDGTRILFSSNRGGSFNLFSTSVGSGQTEQILTSDRWQYPSSWSPDGGTLLFDERSPDTHFDIWEVRLSGERKPRPLLATPSWEDFGKVSPDGRWLAYRSHVSGGPEVYVRPYAGADVRWMVSLDGGSFPVWNRNGRSLFFQKGNAILEAAVGGGPMFTAGKPRVVVQRQRELLGYDVAADGRRFLIAEDVSADPLPLQIVVAPDWFEELKSMVPPAPR